MSAPPAPDAHVFLVPGFLGFAALGELRYFAHVEEQLQTAFAVRGTRVRTHVVETLPTSNISRRTARLLDTVAAKAGDDHLPIFLVGHSTGGLDSRLFLTPGVALESSHAIEPFAARVPAMVAVATPHRGTPSARFFSGRLGQKALILLSLATVYAVRHGHAPLKLMLGLGRVLATLDDVVGLDGSLVDQLFSDFLGDFSAERRAVLEALLLQMSEDWSLLPELTPDGVALFDARTKRRAGVAYGDVVARARVPGVRARLSVGLDPYAQATHTVFAALHRITARMPDRYLVPPNPAQRAALVRGYGRLPNRRDSDGVCPTLSQLYGDVVHVARADHHDVIGNFDAPRHHPPHYDWLASGTGFDRIHFDALWNDVADYCVRSMTSRAGQPR